LLDKSIRELDRERSSLLSQDKMLAAEIKKLARQGQLEAVKLMAKDLVRTRHSIAKLHVLKSQLQAVRLRMQTLKSTRTMADAIRGVTRAMKDMNSQLNVPRLNNIMQDFERQNGRMENTTDTLSDTIDNTMIADGEEEESEELVSQVLDELGCNIDVQLVDAPNSRDGVQVPKVAAPQAETFEYVLEGADSTTDAHGTSIDDDLQTRLDNLRNT
tara:strand:- start:2259 stop:2903 length:645 start_codon:yes stop_codon:yes gene_type:complete